MILERKIVWSGNVLLPSVKSKSNRFENFTYRWKLSLNLPRPLDLLKTVSPYLYIVKRGELRDRGTMFLNNRTFYALTLTRKNVNDDRYTRYRKNLYGIGKGFMWIRITPLRYENI